LNKGLLLAKNGSQDFSPDFFWGFPATLGERAKLCTLGEYGTLGAVKCRQSRDIHGYIAGAVYRRP
jgi:hypothetical protein